MRDNTVIARFERALIQLELLTQRVERALESFEEPEVETDPEAVKAAEEMVKKRRFEILKDVGADNGDYEE